MKEKEKLAVAEAMMKYGGSFVKALGQALLLADSDNAEKIKIAFKEYWEKYWEIYKKVKENEQKTNQIGLGIWKWKARINPERLKEKILKSFFEAGFVIDFDNGLVAETYEEYKFINSIINEVKENGLD